MNHDLFSFFTALVVMTLLDAIWLGTIAPKFYKKHIGFIMAKKPRWGSAVAFYLIFVIGLTTFVIYPGWHLHQTYADILLRGGLYGLVTYATYDLTNQATLAKWPIIVTGVDLTWGTVLSGSTAIISVFILNSFIK